MKSKEKYIDQRTLCRSRGDSRLFSAGALAWAPGQSSWSSHGQFWQLSRPSRKCQENWVHQTFLLFHYGVQLYIHICTKYFVNKFSTSLPEIIVAFGKFYKKCFPPRAKTSFCLSNQKPRVNILEPRHLIVNWAQFFSNVCSFYLFSDIIMELFILQFISSWLFKIDSWLILGREWKYFYSTLITW